ncbi:MAG: NAD(P)-binding domain-containing protein [Cyanobacteria bacterium CRU_2_1]|nr:NAD(P)-binding domain-containing protein [Cyanobacteria bacterium CRU_2_1]
MEKSEAFDVIVAGASGIGVGVVLKDLGLENFAILERHQIGESFRRWPQEMHFITPSFPSHGFGHLDLNAIAAIVFTLILAWGGRLLWAT